MRRTPRRAVAGLLALLAGAMLASPAAQVQIHHRSPDGRRPRTMSSTIRASAQPAVPVRVTSRSFASSGGGGVGPRDSFTRPGYEVAGLACCVRPASVMYLVHARLGAMPKNERRLTMMTVTQTRTDAGLATALRISVSRLARRLRAQRTASGRTEAVL